MNKNEVRKRFRNLRRQLTDTEINDQSQKIAEGVVSEVREKGYKNIHTFLPIQQNREVDTWVVIKTVKKYLPEVKFIISKTDFTSRCMTHYYFDEQTIILENQMGIPEPGSGKTAQATTVEMVLVPLLGYDQSGNRVGYGKGYYDEFLGELAPDTLKAGVSFFNPVEKIESEPHDIKLDICITPVTVYRFN